MKKVIIESPFAGDIEKNLAYVRACMKDCLQRGEAPFASHALYTQPGVLDDTIPEERKKGMTAGFIWGNAADYVVVYADLGVSKGMLHGIEVASERGARIEVRYLGDGWAA